MEMPEYYKELSFYNWDGVFYHNHEIVEKTEEEPQGKIIEDYSDRFCKVELYENGVISYGSICGSYNLKKPQNPGGSTI